MKDVGCPFTFGVFTKWDECLRNAEIEGDDMVKNVTETAEAYKKEFREALQGKSEVYFVNGKNFLEPDVSTHTIHSESQFMYKYSMQTKIPHIVDRNFE